jgi:Zn-dependent M28 family amino/carboxypeptidase
MLAETIGERNVWTYPSLVRAADFIAERFAAMGCACNRQSYHAAGRTVDNIEAVLPGTSAAAEIVVVGAHYDTVPGCPGANDNGTGVVAVLELARRFASRPPAGRTVRFVAFVNEEPPFFQTETMGSLVYAKAAQARGDRIVAMLALETMGYYSEVPGSQQYPAPIAPFYPNVGNFIGFVANVGSAGLVRRAKHAFASNSSFPVQTAAFPAAVPGVGWSDHWSFWEAGYPALMVTDTAPFRYPWYHTAADTPDKVSYDALAQVVDGLEHVVSELASS